MLPLTGTTDPRHVAETLQLLDFELTPDEIRQVEAG
jgi:diketogulonate reductase-like aldo/keto reductase